MPYVHDKINQLNGGWYVVLEDGRVYTEQDSSWASVPDKKSITLMGIKWRHLQYEIGGKLNYFAPGESHFRELGVFGTELRVTPQELVERFIGYYDQDAKVFHRVHVKTGELRVIREPYQPLSAESEAPVQTQT